MNISQSTIHSVFILLCDFSEQFALIPMSNATHQHIIGLVFLQHSQQLLPKTHHYLTAHANLSWAGVWVLVSADVPRACSSCGSILQGSQPPPVCYHGRNTL